jgi:hypothetical protein
MIDYGLAFSLLVTVAVPSLVSRQFVDLALGPALVGLAVGRLVALAIDDPGSIGSVSDMLILRSGVEFWPAVGAGALALAWVNRSAHPVVALASIAPLAMIAYSAYEAACVVRDGCYGPPSTIGLRPTGVATTMLPIGWFMAAAVAGAAAIIGRRMADRSRPMIVVAAAVWAVAVVRSIGSIWLPHIGDGLTRQHLTSIGVACLATVVLAALVSSTARRGGEQQSQPAEHG